jgi:hypothetical protein
VPSGTEVHRLTSVGLGALRPGMHVMVRGTAQPDGTTKATSIIFDGQG